MITTSTPYQLMTSAEFEVFEALPENRDRRFELINGEIVEKMPTEEHGLIVAFLVAMIFNHVQPQKLGRVAVEVRHRPPLDDYNARLPDISFRLAENSEAVVRKGAVPTMPDWAIEVQSPDDAPRNMREKAAYYLHNGSRLVWLIFPTSHIVEACHLDESGTVQIEAVDSGEVRAGGVLDDFVLRVDDIFNVE